MARSVALLVVAACGPKMPPVIPSADPDAASGPDGRRSGAAAIRASQLVTDEVSVEKGDRTDWKAIEIGRSGVLRLELRCENPAGDIDLDVFDGIGARIAGSSAAAGPVKNMAAPVEGPGPYYVRIRASGVGTGSVYTLETRFEGGEALVAENRPRLPRPHREARSARDRPFADAVQGRVISSYREGASLVLHIDKGSAAGIKPGQSGTILEGTAGGTPLDGGGLSVTQVVDDSRSIARTTLKSIGRNTRVSILTGR